MRPASTVLTLGFAAAGLMTAGTAQALGFGKVANATQLGQRLDFGAQVRLDPDESLDRACVFAEVLAGDNLLQPGQVRVTLERGTDPTDRTVRVSTSTLIDEPVVTVTLTLGCTARSTRRFVVFIDPPGIELGGTNTAPADAALLMPQRDDSQVAPLVASLAPEPSRTAAGRVQREPSTDRALPRPAQAGAVAPPPPRPSGIASAPGAEPERSRIVVATARKPSATRRVAVLDKPSAVPHLQLDAPTRPPVVAATPASGVASAVTAALAAASAASGPAGTAPGDALARVATLLQAASAASAAPDDRSAALLLQQERLRVQSLEEGLARLQADAAETRKSVVVLQARLQQAESARGSDAGVWALAGLSAVLAAALALVASRRWRPKAAAPWWKVGTGVSRFSRNSTLVESGSKDPVATATQSLAAAASPAAGDVDVDVDVDLGRAAGDAAVGLALPPDLAATSPYWTVPSPPTAPVPTAPAFSARLPDLPPAAARPQESSSVEELIDLEQQADFFIVLGQDDAAIELLTHHLEADGGASPLPHLKLLEIYRRRGDAAGYEAIRIRFSRDFNVHAPAWNVDLQDGRSLEEYPDVVARLQALWPDPPQALALLERLLFRRVPSDATFDLPAYRELLSLHSIARDPTQAAWPAASVDEGARGLAVGEVDLLLPLDAAAGTVEPIAWLNATTRQAVSSAKAVSPSLPRSGVVAPSLVEVDVDVSRFDETDEPQPVTRPAAVNSPRVAPAAPAAAHYESLETVPSALRRPDGHPDQSMFVDLVLEPVDATLP